MIFFRSIFFILIFGCLPNTTFGQYISVSDNFIAQELVENKLINSPCANVSNFSVSGGNFGSQQSFGYFTANGSSFPFDNGVVLSTGKAVSSSGPNSSILSDGDTSWLGDDDLENALGVNNSINATVLEFDFVPLSNKISFDYIFSSEQYLLNPRSSQCDFTDGFAFLLKEVGSTNAYQNLALIPNTTIPVRVNTVRGPGTICPEANETFFGGFNDTEHPTNFNGQTKIMQAQANVTSGKLYHIKLVVADQGNNLYDSAIFLGGGSFKFEKDLGPDQLIATNNPVCQNNTFPLDATESGTNSYKWFKNNIDTGITSPTYTVTDEGIYRVEVSLGATICKSIGEITIEYSPLPVLTNTIIVQCDDNKDGLGLFNLSKADKIITNNDSSLSTIVYYEQITDAQNQDVSKAISNPNAYESTSKTIYASVKNTFGCANVATIDLKLSNNTVPKSRDLESCDLDGKVDGFYGFDLSIATPIILAGLPSGLVVEYYETLNDALLQINVLPNTFRNTVRYQMRIYARILNGADCYGIIPLDLFVNSFEDLPDENIVLCEKTSKKLEVDRKYIWFDWNNGSKDFFTEVSIPGTYMVTITDKNTCVATKKFTVEGSGKATITNVNTNDFQESNSAIIEYLGSGDYEFSIDGIIFKDSPIFENLAPGIFTAWVKDKNGCGITSKKFYVLNYPRYFTPNGDGINDSWFIKNINVFPNSEISIYDRYGKFLYQFIGTNKGWDGKFNSVDLPSTDYWFVINIGIIKIIKGHFTLKR
ncbi:T9SS type B sorting domain-containing protein [Flavobacterium luteum]|uniref:T9SS type B sorting domain-containing protein n=2 Tax=Flavobacterium luteum TaxID=2026654 RepID=A0A7J5ACQ3_9FLAO|nr:T9SS type B sorting domain-containing protein [Flavobacterium luteum]